MNRFKHKFTFASKLLLIATLSSSAYSQQSTDHWIDKNEDENYTARHECSFVQAGESFVMFGGRESSQKLDIYDYQNNSWETGTEAPKEFNHFQATFHKGFIWVIGSFKNNKFPREPPESHVWLYFPPTNKWIQGPLIPKDRQRGSTGLVVHQDKFYILGGNTIGHAGGYVNWFDEYDPTTNTWTILNDAPHARDHFHAAIIENTLYAAGGRKTGGEGGIFAPLVKAVDTYDFMAKTWSQLDNALPTPRAAPGIAVFQNKLLVMGGEGEGKGPAFATVEAFDPTTKSWENRADMHYARHGTQAIVSGNGIYMAGGSPKTGGGRQLNMEVYNEDKPTGEKITVSHFEAPEQLALKAGKTKVIKIENTGGNAASFITSIKVQGTNRDSFRIDSNLDLTLINANSLLLLSVTHIADSKSDTAQIVISYNGDQNTNIQLISK